jgi:hypothetical protein
METSPLDDSQVFVPVDIEAALGISQAQSKELVRELHKRRAEF